MQVAVDPDTTCLVGQEWAFVSLVSQVMVEEGRRATVEGEGRCCHLAELRLERRRVAGHEVAKGLFENIENLGSALGLLVGGLWDCHRIESF